MQCIPDAFDWVLIWFPRYLDLILNKHLNITLINHWFIHLNYKLYFGAISTEHFSSELRVIGTTARRVDSYFLHITMHTFNPLYF